jgi:RecA-family ATPase
MTDDCGWPVKYKTIDGEIAEIEEKLKDTTLEPRLRNEFEQLLLAKKAWGRPVSVKGLLVEPPRPMQWFIDGRIPMARGGLITGIGGSSKSRLAYHLAIGAAIGRLPWGWTVARRGKAVLILTEDTIDDVHDVIYSIVQSEGLSDEELEMVNHCLIPYPLAGQDCRLLTMENGTLQKSHLYDTLISYLQDLGDVVLVALDPALAITDGDELDQSHQRTLGKLADDLAVNTGATVVLISHATKASLNQTELNSHNSRGGGAITDAVRFELAMRTMTKDEASAAGITDLEERKRLVQLVATKGNRLPPSAFVPIWLRRGDHGNLSEADVVMEKKEAEKDTGPNGNDVRIFQVLEKLAEKTPSVHLKDWRVQCICQKLIAHDNPTKAEKQMQRAIGKLVDARFITKSGHGIYSLFNSREVLDDLV